MILLSEKIITQQLTVINGKDLALSVACTYIGDERILIGIRKMAGFEYDWFNMLIESNGAKRVSGYTANTVYYKMKKSDLMDVLEQVETIVFVGFIEVIEKVDHRTIHIDYDYLKSKLTRDDQYNNLVKKEFCEYNHLGRKYLDDYLKNEEKIKSIIDRKVGKKIPSRHQSTGAPSMTAI